MRRMGGVRNLGKGLEWGGAGGGDIFLLGVAKNLEPSLAKPQSQVNLQVRSYPQVSLSPAL